MKKRVTTKSTFLFRYFLKKKHCSSTLGKEIIRYRISNFWWICTKKIQIFSPLSHHKFSAAWSLQIFHHFLITNFSPLAHHKFSTTCSSQIYSASVPPRVHKFTERQHALWSVINLTVYSGPFLNEFSYDWWQKGDEKHVRSISMGLGVWWFTVVSVC